MPYEEEAYSNYSYLVYMAEYQDALVMQRAETVKYFDAEKGDREFNKNVIMYQPEKMLYFLLSFLDS